jgi:IS5 family transposase
MAVKDSGQLSLADALRFRRPGLNERLEKIEALIDWVAVAALLRPLDPPRRGAPGYAALGLFKAVLLAQWNGLSDEAMEEMLADRYSYQRFCGFSASGPVPDHATLWRFREALAAAGLVEAVFAEVNRQLDAKGLVLRQGTLVDATIIAAQVAPPKPPKQEPPKQEPAAPQGQAAEPVPAEQRPPSKLVRNPLDPDAGWTRRGARLHFGYKGHIGVDQGSGLIRAQVFTSAEVNDTVMADGLIAGDEAAVYADKAYDSHARRQRLESLGIKYRIQTRPNKHHPITERQTLRNKLIGRIRGRVETVFGFLKRNSWLARARYFNKARNAAAFALLCTAYNLHKAIRIA